MILKSVAVLFLVFCFIVVSFLHYYQSQEYLSKRESRSFITHLRVLKYASNTLRLMLKLRLCLLLLVHSISTKLLPLDDVFEF